MTRNKKERNSSRSTRPASPTEPQKKLSFTPPRVSRDEIKKAGEEAADLLNSPIFNLTVNSVVDDLGLQILQTEPHEHQKREWLYQQGAAIGRVSQKLVEFVQVAQALHMDELAAEESAQREQTAEQGFASAPMQ
ncbi:MAG: hypothetical protein QNI96_05270 [Woeseiaceae bacterium]|nr:hypothetical protein [Woeseiaceae bacterium]